MIRKLTRIAAVVSAGLVWSASEAYSQNYPAQPIRIVVSSSPGGPNDTVARLASQILSEARAACRGRESRRSGWRARRARSRGGKARRLHADGRQHQHDGRYSGDAGQARLRFVEGLRSHRQVRESYQLLVVHSSSPWKTAKDLIEAAKAEPGKFTYAHTGPGGSPHLSSELFQARAGIKLVPVPYRSGGELATAVLTQATDTSIGDIAVMIPLIREGRFRALKRHDITLNRFWIPKSVGF